MDPRWMALDENGQVVDWHQKTAWYFVAGGYRTAAPSWQLEEEGGRYHSSVLQFGAYTFDVELSPLLVMERHGGVPPFSMNHYFLEAVIDFDGDGTPELLLEGPNNELRTYLVVVRLEDQAGQRRWRSVFRTRTDGGMVGLGGPGPPGGPGGRN